MIGGHDQPAAPRYWRTQDTSAWSPCLLTPHDTLHAAGVSCVIVSCVIYHNVSPAAPSKLSEIKWKITHLNDHKAVNISSKEFHVK